MKQSPITLNDNQILPLDLVKHVRFLLLVAAIFFMPFLSCAFSFGLFECSENEKSNHRISIEELSPCHFMPFSCDIVGTDVLCNILASGEADATVTGGSMPYTYLWSNGATTEDITNLTVGTYQLTVTDGGSNMTSCSVVIGGFQCSITQAPCDVNNLGVAVSNVTDGTPPYVYLWSTGETTSTISRLIPGNYNLLVTDVNDCETVCNIEIERCADCDQLCQTAFARSPGALQCFIDLGYDRWGWSNGLLPEGFYNFDLYVGAEDCLIGDGELVGAMSLEYSGDTVIAIYEVFANYSLLVTHLYVGCEVVASNGNISSVDPNAYPYEHTPSGATRDTFVVDVSSIPCEGFYVIGHAEVCRPNELECQITGTNINCPGAGILGSADVNVTGGKPPYTYLWSNGATDANISGLYPGVYEVVLTDIQECESSCEVSIDRCDLCDEICQTSFARLEGVENCFDQYGLSRWGWTNGLILEGMYVFDLYAEALNCNITTADLVGELRVNYSGDYIQVIYNMFGEYYMRSNNLYIGCGPLPDKNGILTADPDGYPYGHVLDKKTTDTFFIDVDVLPCEGVYIIAHAEVCKPNVLQCDITGTPVDCSGGNTGSAMATIVGGTPPYSFTWSSGQTTQSITGLFAGVYELTVTDAINCESSCDIFVSYPSTETPNLGPYCQNDPPYDLAQIFPNPPMMGTWTGPGVVDEILYPSNLSTGNYRILYVDDVNCQSGSIKIAIDTICCPLDYLEANQRLLIGTQTTSIRYETNGILESVQTIDANTIYDSKLEINLKPNFEVKLGKTFEALIDGCQ